jgi:hypothetical protein
MSPYLKYKAVETKKQVFFEKKGDFNRNSQFKIDKREKPPKRTSGGNAPTLQSNSVEAHYSGSRCGGCNGNRPPGT